MYQKTQLGMIGCPQVVLVRGVAIQCLQGAQGGMGEIQGESRSQGVGGSHLCAMGGRMEDHQEGLVATQERALGMRRSTLSALWGRRSA